MLTLDQRRAQRAWNHVSKLNKGQDSKDVSTKAKGFASRIQTSGLAPTLAFTATKKEKDHQVVLSAVEEHLFNVLFHERNGNSNLIEKLINGDSHTLRRATEEAMAFLTWLARLAEAKGKES